MMKENTTESFCEMVGEVNRCVDMFQSEEVTFDPFAQSKVFDINVTSAGCWFLGITHCGTAVVVLVCYGCSFLGNVQIPEDTADEE